MPDTVVAPPPAAAPAAPAAPASTPTPAPSTPAAPSVPSAPTTSQPAETTERSLEQRISEGWDKAKASVSTESTEEPAADTTPAAPPAEPAPAVVAPPEEITAPAGEPTTEDKTEPAAEMPEIDFGEPTTPQDFAAAIKGDAATEKFFNEHPELKQSVFAALRRDSENRALREIIPDVETAKVMSSMASTFKTIDDGFLQATTPEGATDFLKMWVSEAMITDEQGKPVIENGVYKLHPSLTYVFDHIYNNKNSVLRQQAEKEGNEQLLAALDVIKDATSPSSSALDNVPPELKPHADALKQREQALDNERKAESARQREQYAQQHQQSVDRAEESATTSIKGQLKDPFTRAGLTEFERSAAGLKIAELIDQKLENNTAFKMKEESVLKQAPGEARERAHSALILQYASAYLGPIAAQVIREAKGGTLNRQADRANKVAAQTDASKTEPRGTSIKVPGAQPMSDKDLQAQIRKEFADANNGEEAPLEYVMAEGFKRKLGKPATR